MTHTHKVKVDCFPVYAAFAYAPHQIGKWIVSCVGLYPFWTTTLSQLAVVDDFGNLVPVQS